MNNLRQGPTRALGCGRGTLLEYDYAPSKLGCRWYLGPSEAAGAGEGVKAWVGELWCNMMFRGSNVEVSGYPAGGTQGSGADRVVKCGSVSDGIDGRRACGRLNQTPTDGRKTDAKFNEPDPD